MFDKPRDFLLEEVDIGFDYTKINNSIYSYCDNKYVPSDFIRSRMGPNTDFFGKIIKMIKDKIRGRLVSPRRYALPRRNLLVKELFAFIFPFFIPRRVVPVVIAREEVPCVITLPERKIDESVIDDCRSSIASKGYYQYMDRFFFIKQVKGEMGYDAVFTMSKELDRHNLVEGKLTPMRENKFRSWIRDLLRENVESNPGPTKCVTCGHAFKFEGYIEHCYYCSFPEFTILNTDSDGYDKYFRMCLRTPKCSECACELPRMRHFHLRGVCPLYILQTFRCRRHRLLINPIRVAILGKTYYDNLILADTVSGSLSSKCSYVGGDIEWQDRWKMERVCHTLNGRIPEWQWTDEGITATADDTKIVIPYDRDDGFFLSSGDQKEYVIYYTTPKIKLGVDITMDICLRFTSHHVFLNPYVSRYCLPPVSSDSTMLVLKTVICDVSRQKMIPFFCTLSM